MDVKKIKQNRKLMEEDAAIDSPYVPVIADGDADYGERLYDQMPPNKVGLIPPGKKE